MRIMKITSPCFLDAKTRVLISLFILSRIGTHFIIMMNAEHDKASQAVPSLLLGRWHPLQSNTSYRWELLWWTKSNPGIL